MSEFRMRTFDELCKDLLAIYELADEALQYRIPKNVEYNLEGIQRIAWDWAKEADKVLERLDELARAELEAHYEKYFSIVQEDEEGQVWVPLEEVYEAVMKARHEVKESAGVEEY